MKLQRQQLTQHKLQDHTDNDFIAESMQERLEMVWELTREVASLSPHHDVERRLQRHMSALLAQNAEFLLVGAYAMAAHGFPRATMDI